MPRFLHGEHWFRARFFQQYRLFFRYHAPSKVIVFAWVNDEDTKRAHESGDDAYRVLRKMLASAHPPDDWNQLLAEGGWRRRAPESRSAGAGAARWKVSLKTLRRWRQDRRH